MLKAVRKFLSDFAAPAPVEAEATDERVAAAALLIHIAVADGTISATESACGEALTHQLPDGAFALGSRAYGGSGEIRFAW